MGNQKPIVLRTTQITKNETTYRARLLMVAPLFSQIVIEEMIAETKESEVTEKRQEIVKELLIRPDYTDLTKDQIKKRVAEVEEYVKSKSIAEALEEVGKEVVKPNPQNKEGKETVLEFAPQIEIDLGYKIQKYYNSVPRIVEVPHLVQDTTYKYKKVKSWDFYFRMRPVDFLKHAQNYIKEHMD